MGERHASTEEWRAIARGPRPLYHVLTWHDIEDWAPGDFYSVGQSDWEDFSSHWIHYTGALHGACLEIGCGAGRITRMLAGEFDFVHAVDVSEDMIARADAATPDNVQFHRVDGTRLPLGDAIVDAVFSVHVLQHLDDFPDVSAYMAEAYRVLAPGGTLMVHVPVERRSTRRRALRGELRLWRSRRGLRHGREHSAVRYREYPWEEVWRLLDTLGFERIELRMIPVSSNGYHHAFWLASKP